MTRGVFPGAAALVVVLLAHAVWSTHAGGCSAGNCEKCVGSESCVWNHATEKCGPSSHVHGFVTGQMFFKKTQSGGFKKTICTLNSAFSDGLTKFGSVPTFNEVCLWAAENCNKFRSKRPRCDSVLSVVLEASARLHNPAETGIAVFAPTQLWKESKAGELAKSLVSSTDQEFTFKSELEPCRFVKDTILVVDRRLKTVERKVWNVIFSVDRFKKLDSSENNLLGVDETSTDNLEMEVIDSLQFHYIDAMKINGLKHAIDRMSRDIAKDISELLTLLKIEKKVLDAISGTRVFSDLRTLALGLNTLARRMKESLQEASLVPKRPVDWTPLSSAIQRLSQAGRQVGWVGMLKNLIQECASVAATSADRHALWGIAETVGGMEATNALLRRIAVEQQLFPMMYDAPPDPLEAVSSYFVIGSLHGDIEATSAALRMTGLISFEKVRVEVRKNAWEEIIVPKWTGAPRDRIVVAGNFMGHGPNTEQVIQWLRGLSLQAPGRFIVLRGPSEEEFLTSPAGFRSGEGFDRITCAEPKYGFHYDEAKTMTDESLQAEVAGRVQGFWNGQVGKWLHSLKTTAAIENIVVTNVRAKAAVLKKALEKAKGNVVQAYESIFRASKFGSEYSCEELRGVVSLLLRNYNQQPISLLLNGVPNCAGMSEKRGLAGVRPICNTSAYNIDTVNSRYSRWRYQGKSIRVPREIFVGSSREYSGLERIYEGGFTTSIVAGYNRERWNGVFEYGIESRDLISGVKLFSHSTVDELKRDVGYVENRLDCPLGDMPSDSRASSTRTYTFIDPEFPLDDFEKLRRAAWEKEGWLAEEEARPVQKSGQPVSPVYLDPVVESPRSP